MSMHERVRSEASDLASILAPSEEEEAVSSTRFVGGAVPPVTLADAGSRTTTASDAAYGEPDADVVELKTKVKALIDKKFGGDFKKAFTHYDADKDDTVSKSELTALLSDAGVGNGLTRGIWASRIIEKLDKSGDRKIGWDEFESVFSGSASA